MLRATWVLLAVTIAWLSFQDVGVANQLALSATAIGGLLLMQMCRLSQVFRLLFVAFATFITLRYLAWRITDTLPDPTGISFIAGFLLFLAEVYGIAMYFFGVFVNIHPIDRKTVPLPDDPELLPSVDVFVPSYNEDQDLLELTLTAARQIRYPAGKLNVYLLDDGGTAQKRADRDPAKARAALDRHETLRALCARIGVGYLTRERNEQAKAGNINAALPRTSGDLILILDADHVPTQNFLERTVGHFLKDPKLFLVQTPHFFINPDPIERNLNTWERMPSENEMFYCVGQKGLDFWNASFFCGSAALLRRDCLEEIGGIQGVSITEDAETALELHARGYNSVYVSEPMIAGLQPETFAGFIGQRTRWAQGMMQIFLLKNPLFKRGLTLPQRISYLSSSTFWLFPLARAIFLFIPLTYLFFGMKIYNASLQEFMAYALGHLICSLLLANHLFGKVRWPFISELYEMAQCLFLTPALISVFLRPRAPTFKVTSKAETLEKSFISQLANPLLVMFALLLAGAAAGIWRYVHFPLEHENLAIVFGWNLINLIFISAALGVVRERRQRRQMPRIPHAQSVVVDLSGHRVQARIEDVSATGVQLILDAGESIYGHMNSPRAVMHAVLPGEDSSSEIPLHIHHAVIEDETVVLGVAFAPNSQEEREHVVRLCYGCSQHWSAFQTSRQGRRTILGGFLFLLSLSIIHGMTSLMQTLRERAVITEGWSPPKRGRAKRIALEFGGGDD